MASIKLGSGQDKQVGTITDKSPIVLVASSNCSPTVVSGAMPVVEISFRGAKLGDLLLTLTAAPTVINIHSVPLGDVRARWVSGAFSYECRISLIGGGVL